MISSDVPNLPRKVSFNWISESFQLFMRDIWTWILAIIIYIGCSLVLSFTLLGIFTLAEIQIINPLVIPSISAATDPVALIVKIVLGWLLFLSTCFLLGWPLGAFFSSGLFKMANKSVRGEPISIGDLFSGGNATLVFMGFGIVFVVLYYVGLLACIVGAFVVTALLFPAYALLADGDGIGMAIQKSFDGMKRDWLNGAAFVFAYGLLCFLTGLCLLPLLVTVPMGIIIASLAYRDMIGMPLGATTITAEPTSSWPPPPTGFSSGGYEPSQTPPEPQVESPGESRRKTGDPTESDD